MPFSIMGLAAREGLEHLGYREAKYQHWQGFAAPFVFSQRPAPCRARFSSSWRHWCDPAVREGLCSPWLFWELLERFEVFLFGWFCIACFVLFWVFVWFFFPLKWKVLFWIQFLLYRNLQLPGFSRKHGSFGLHFRIPCLGFFTHSKSLESVGVIELIVPVRSVCCHRALVRTPPSTPAHLRSTFHCVSCFWLSPVESCTLWELFAVDDISSGNYNCTWVMWNDCLPL